MFINVSTTVHNKLVQCMIIKTEPRISNTMPISKFWIFA